jgi:hypothetical protein
MTACEFRALLDRIDSIRTRVALAAVAAGFAYSIADCAIRDPWGTLRAAYWPGGMLIAILALHVGINIMVWALRVVRERTE